MLKRLQSFRWAEFLNDEKQDQKINELKKKSLRLQDVVDIAEQELKNAKEAERDYFKQGRAFPIELEDFKNEAQKKYDEADLDLNLVNGEIKTEENKPRGSDAEKVIQKRIKKFIESGRKDIEARRDFNSWFINEGLAVVMDLRTGRFEIGIGEVENNVLVELDMRLEHAAMFMKDGATFVDPDGKPLTIDDIKKTISQEERRKVRLSTKSKAKKVTAEDKKEYEDRVHAGGGKTLKDLLKEQGD